MNAQANYVFQGFLLALLVPIVGLLISKFNSKEFTGNPIEVIESKESSTISPLPASLNKGKTLFLQKCASCHSVFKEMVAPALKDFQHRGQWADRDKLHEWLRNPALFMKNDLYAKKLKEKYKTYMIPFPDITKEEVNAIADYVIWVAEN